MTRTVRTLTRIAAALLALCGLVVAVPSAAHAAGWRYTVVAFSGATDRTMDVYESDDATSFTVLQKAAYSPPTGRVRDPSIFRAADGEYYVTYTTANGATIGFARSSDRVHWTKIGDYGVPYCCFLLPGTGDGHASVPGFGSTGSLLREVPSLSPFTTKAWAPEWFVDGGRVNVILSMSTGGGFVPYLMTALDSTFTRWSLPTPLDGIGADHIDTTVVKIGSTYHAFTKNETKKVIQHAVATSLAGPYRFVPAGDWGTLVEGPELVQLPDGAWRIFLDAYTKGKYLYADSTDGLDTWTPLREVPGLSGAARHIGIMREAS
ncbi:hypothetical protein nbrc107696_42470 [Gordonia spumicola]|uniref:Arabinofuranosidase n=1 Tax=Gordonia spumicola TaxID=589161 RepID=A0A7I9VFC6_9ACTN|nr:glycoside hydrolase family 43 protein [Gordonia spumicola]GEE03801.1 hypothetical protein nbrc107696_42470 [Gordonia spumicola]